MYVCLFVFLLLFLLILIIYGVITIVLRTGPGRPVGSVKLGIGYSPNPISIKKNPSTLSMRLTPIEPVDFWPDR